MTKYSARPDFTHELEPCTGILLANLGTPDTADTDALRRYLAEFLSDTRVIELPRVLWWPILHGIILRTRPRRSAEAYKKIWTEDGSPLLIISRQQSEAIQKILSENLAGPIRVELGMRYGNPSIADALKNLRNMNAERILVFPLYPQYSAATTASTFDAVTSEMQTWRLIPEIRMVRNYHDHPDYIDALSESVRKHWMTNGKPDKLLFSFHGLPKQYFVSGDPYFCQCHKTARLVAEQVDLKEGQWLLSFQSRFGPKEWLKPYTDKVLKKWGAEGTDHVQVICPGFSADCLETLEEIKIQNCELFLKSGGKKFSYIPALNNQADHINTLVDIIYQHCHGWPEFNKNWSKEKIQNDLQKTVQLAKSMGAEQ